MERLGTPSSSCLKLCVIIQCSSRNDGGECFMIWVIGVIGGIISFLLSLYGCVLAIWFIKERMGTLTKNKFYA